MTYETSVFSSDNILPFLTFLGLALGFVSSLWGIFSKNTDTDDKGKSRLNREGQMTLFFAGTAFVIALLSFGIGQVEKQANAVRKAEEKRLAILESRKAEQERLASLVVNLETLTKTYEIEANQYANALKAQVEREGNAAKVAEQNRENLVAITGTLDGVERLLQPVGPISGDANWEIRLTAEDQGKMREAVGCAENEDGASMLYTRDLGEEGALDVTTVGIDRLADFLNGIEANAMFGVFGGRDLEGVDSPIEWSLRDRFDFFFFCGDPGVISVDVEFESVKVDFAKAGIYASVRDFEYSEIWVTLRSLPEVEFGRDFDMRFRSICLQTSGEQFEDSFDGPTQWQSVGAYSSVYADVTLRRDSC